MIIHVSGPQGSGKSTIGKIIKEKYNSIYVKDLDDLLINEFTNEYIKNTDSQNITSENYIIKRQEYIYNFIENHKDKPIVFVGLNYDNCLGPITISNKRLNGSENLYDLKADYKFYINLLHNDLLKQKFLRQVDKLHQRKEWFFDNWLKDKKIIQDKLFRFINITEWEKDVDICDKKFKEAGYEFLSQGDIIENIRMLLNAS